MEISELSYKKLWVRIVYATILTFIFSFSALWLHGKNTSDPLPFILTDQNGQVYNSQEANSYKLIFFGFTHCPDVCPTGLSNMAQVLQALGETTHKIQPVFITVDPTRDTPEIIKSYIGNFHPRLIGLTGTQAELKIIQDQYAVYAQKVKPPEYNDYLMDHSAHMYLTDKDDIVLEIFDYRLAPSKMAERIRPFLEVPN